MAADCRVACENWSLVRGEIIQQALIVKRISTSEKYEHPPLDEIIDTDRAVFLETETLQPCDIHFEFPPTCSVYAIAIITDCQKLEMFIGKCEEYHKTLYGELVDEVEGSRIYYHDVELSNTPVSNFNIRLIPKEVTLWIYGIVVALKPNMKALADSIFAPTIDFNNVQNILAESKNKLTPDAERCRKFVQSYASSKTTLRPPNLDSIISMMNGNLLNNTSTVANKGSGEYSSETSNVEPNYNSTCKEQNIKSQPIGEANEIFKPIMDYVDSTISEMEKRIQSRIDELERRQHMKLDKILELLNNKTDQ